MKVLGIDPGIARTGWGIIQIQNSEFKVQNYGCIETSSKLENSQRLKELYTKITKNIDFYKPDIIAIEDLFFNTNAKTALIVGQARGVILLAGAQKKIRIATYTPLQVKVAITGYGRADKNQIGQMIKTILKLNNIPKPDDVADALAIALTHAFSDKINSKIFTVKY